MARISVCLASYNGERFIREQVASILSELGDDDELIISDDLSKDSTVHIIEAFHDDRIVILKGTKFGSAIKNFENALRHASGDYIFLSDQDDQWLPGRVARCLSYFNKYDLVVCDCRIVDENLQEMFPSYFEMVDAKSGFMRNLVRTSPYIGCCMAFTKDVLKLALPFPSQIPMHDFWIAMLAELQFRVGFCREPLVLYRRHGTNLSATGSASKFSLWKKASFRVQLLTALAPRLLRSV